MRHGAAAALQHAEAWSVFNDMVSRKMTSTADVSHSNDSRLMIIDGYLPVTDGEVFSSCI